MRKKDKLLQMRVDDSFLKKLDFLQHLNDYRNHADTIRKTIEKECRREGYKDVDSGQDDTTQRCGKETG